MASLTSSISMCLLVGGQQAHQALSEISLKNSIVLMCGLGVGIFGMVAIGYVGMCVGILAWWLMLACVSVW